MLAAADVGLGHGGSLCWLTCFSFNLDNTTGNCRPTFEIEVEVDPRRPKVDPFVVVVVVVVVVGVVDGVVLWVLNRRRRPVGLALASGFAVWLRRMRASSVVLFESSAMQIHPHRYNAE